MALPLLVGCGAIFGALVLRLAFDPFHQSVPLCPFFALTGLYCPGCGGTRAIHALAGGDVALALRYWPPLIVAGPVSVWLWCAWIRAAWQGRRLLLSAPPWLLWVACAATVVFAVVRNLPGFETLRPPL